MLYQNKVNPRKVQLSYIMNILSLPTMTDFCSRYHDPLFRMKKRAKTKTKTKQQWTTTREKQQQQQQQL